MPNGARGDDPLNDVVAGHRVYSRHVDALVGEVILLGGEEELRRAFPISSQVLMLLYWLKLRRLRKRLLREAVERGWDVEALLGKEPRK